MLDEIILYYNDCVTNSKMKNGKTWKNKYDSILGFYYSENMAKF